MPLPRIASRAERRAAEGIGAVGAGDRADLDPGQRHVAVGARGQHLDHRPGGRLAPDVVDDDVDVGRRGHLVEAEGEVGAEGGQLGEALRAAPGGDHAGGAEALRHLDRHPAGVPRGAEDSTSWPAAKSIRRRSATHEDISGVQGRRDQHRVGLGGEDDAAVETRSRSAPPSSPESCRRGSRSAGCPRGRGRRRRPPAPAAARRCSCSGTRPPASGPAGGGRRPAPRPRPHRRRRPGRGARGTAGGESKAVTTAACKAAPLKLVCIYELI